MKKHFNNIIFLLILIITCSCGIKEKKTTMVVADPDRHYYPILRGQELDVQYVIENSGKEPLFITNIHSSCGCILVDESSFKVLPVGGKGFIKLKYNSSKNIGYVKHYITIYANLENATKQELTFDLHVVPGALYTKDYEEIHKEQQEKGLNEKNLVDGYENNLGYYLDDSFE